MKKKISKKYIKLSKDVKPSYYTLTIKPDLLSSTFSGEEIIEIDITKDTKKIFLHAKDLDIEIVKLVNKKNKKDFIFAKKISYNKEHETATFYFRDNIEKGSYLLHISFCGIINDKLKGFYKSKYVVDGIEKTIATTQFEATDARMAFPCFDEPEHKAIFEVKLIIQDNNEAISNTMPTEIREHESGYKVVSFSPTPVMSTYLLAFIVGEFEYIEGHTKEGVSVRVFTTKGKKNQSQFALDVAIKSLEFFNQYFDIPYPLPNLDLIAIPDFASGAMENWGAITFRETALLVDIDNSSLSNKQWVALVISHELAHQWFGNLVTMKWWTDLWLNEGFASYIEYLAINEIFPHWHIWNHFLISDHNVALRLDGLSSSHPIEVKVNHPDEISAIFDSISYSKGASIIRMLAEYLGHDTFREGLRYYLKKHSYKNTETVDLWNAFEKVSGKPVEKIMNSWTRQTGYPLISLTKEKSYLKIDQERFFSSRISKKENKDRNLWQVPIIYDEINNHKKNEYKILLDRKSTIISENSLGKMNKNESSFFRVKYDKETLKFIQNEIRENKMPLIDRLGAVRDIFALAEGGYIGTTETLEFIENYKDEDEYIVWVEISAGLNKIYNLFSDKNTDIKYKKYALSLFSPLAKKIGFEKRRDEKHTDIFLRSLALAQASFYGDKKIIKELRSIWDNRMIRPIDKDIRAVVYGTVARNGNEKDWNNMLNLYKRESLEEEKDRISRAMALFKDEKLIAKTLDFAMSKEVRDQDRPFIIAVLLQNKESRDMAYKFIKKNWKLILEKYGSGLSLIQKLIYPLENFNKEKDLKDLQKFFKQNVAPGADRTLLQTYEKITSNIAWLSADKNKVKTWLSKNY